MERRVQEASAPTAAVAAAAAPVIDNTHLPKPIVMRCDEEASITVKISGFPKPVTRWQIGRKKVKESSKYRLKNEGLYYTLIVSRVTIDLEQGVWVISTNQYGEDCCLLEVKTSDTETNNVDRIETTSEKKDLKTSKSSGRKKKLRSSSSHDTRSIVSLDTYKSEMEQRNRMRSVDDVMNASLDIRSTRSGRVSHGPDQNGSLRDKRYSSTEAVHNELQANSIPPLSFDDQSFASASSIPGTPYQERKMPNFDNSDNQKVAKVKKSRRARSASVTDRSKDSEDKPPKPKGSKVPKHTASSATNLNGKVEDAEKLKPPIPPPSSVKASSADPIQSAERDESKPKKKKLRKRTTSKSSILSSSSFDKSLDDLDSMKLPTDSAHQSTPQTPPDGEISGVKSPTVDQGQKPDTLISITKPQKVSAHKSTPQPQPTEEISGVKSSPVNQSQKPDDTLISTTKPPKVSAHQSTPHTPPAGEISEDKSPPVNQSQKPDDMLISITDDNNNDIWGLFGMKLNVLCQYLLNGKEEQSPTDEEKKNQINNQSDSKEAVDSKDISAILTDIPKLEPEVESTRLSKTTDVVEKEKSMEDRGDKVQEIPSVADLEKKPPTGKKKPKRPKLPVNETPENDRIDGDHQMRNGPVDNRDVKSNSPSRHGRKSEDSETERNQDSEKEQREIRIVILPPKTSVTKAYDEPKTAKQDAQVNTERPTEGPTEPSESSKEVPSSLVDVNKSEPVLSLPSSPKHRKPRDSNTWQNKEFEDAASEKAKSPTSSARIRTNLKPARSEECLVKRRASEADIDREPAQPAPGRLRVARSVDRLAADAGEVGHPLIKRRSLSKEWQVVTVTTTEEIIIVQKKPDNDVIQKDNNDVIQKDKFLAPNQNGVVYGSMEKLPLPEIKYIDSEDSVDDFTWPTPPPSPLPGLIEEIPVSKAEFNVKPVEADVGGITSVDGNVSLPKIDLRSGTKVSKRLYEPRIGCGIKQRIEALSLHGYGDRKSKNNDDDALQQETTDPKTAIQKDIADPTISETVVQKEITAPVISATVMQKEITDPTLSKTAKEKEITDPTISETALHKLAIEPMISDTREEFSPPPPPINMSSFPISVQTNSPTFTAFEPEPVAKTSPFVSTAEIILSPKPSESLKRSGSVTRLFCKSNSVTEDDVFSEKGKEDQRKEGTRMEKRPSSHDMCTQTDETDGVLSPDVASEPDESQPNVHSFEKKESIKFELVPDSIRQVDPEEGKLSELKPENIYYTVAQNNAASPVIVHEYSELLSFCKKEQYSVAEAEENILKTQQQRQDIIQKLESLWTDRSRPPRVARGRSETVAGYSYGAYRKSPSRERITSVGADRYNRSRYTGLDEKRPSSDSSL